MHCTLLHCAALYCIVLLCNALHCSVLHYTALYCIALHCTLHHFTALNSVMLCTLHHPTAVHTLHCTASVSRGHPDTGVVSIVPGSAWPAIAVQCSKVHCFVVHCAELVHFSDWTNASVSSVKSPLDKKQPSTLHSPLYSFLASGFRLH